MSDNVNHPTHYESTVPGIECIEVVEHFDYCRGNAIKYIWRAGKKSKETEIEDLQKAIWYLQESIRMLEENKVWQENKQNV